MDAWTIIIIITLLGFLALAALLLVPVYRFLRREERASREWTADEIARRRTAQRRSDEEKSASAGVRRRAD